MRITGGKYKGRTIECPHGDLELRPSMDRMRESVFAILGDLEGLSFLDLFAGSGALGLEAASRGAYPVVCVEKDRKKRNTLIRNLGISERRIECKILPSELYVLRAKDSYDLVFCDPPFPYSHKIELLVSIEGSKLLREGSLLLIHYPVENKLPERIGNSLDLVDRRAYGRSIVNMYKKRAQANPA